MAGNRQLDLALEPILLKLQRPMAVNLRREAQLTAPGGHRAPRAPGRRAGRATTGDVILDELRATARAAYLSRATSGSRGY